MHASYEEAVAQHEWVVPEHYNIAADVCDKHPPDKLAMIHEHFDGTVREVRWGELQAMSNRFASLTCSKSGSKPSFSTNRTAPKRSRGPQVHQLPRLLQADLGPARPCASWSGSCAACRPCRGGERANFSIFIRT